MSRHQAGPDVVVVGSINADLVLTVARHPHPGETLLGGGGHSTPGGKGANQAVAAALRGARTAMVGAVGDDAAAPVALSLLREAEVDLDQVAVRPGPTGLAVVTLSETGENTIVVVPGANATVDPGWAERAAPLLEVAPVCVLQGEIPLESAETAARIAREAGRRVIVNAAPALALPTELLRAADPLVVNEHEAAIVLGSAPGTARGAEPPRAPTTPEEATAMARLLLAAGARSVVVTLGGAGVVVVDHDAESHLPARPVEAVDTVGAGDAFVGALAAGLARGLELANAAEDAVAVAAYAVAHPGAQASYPRLGDPLP